MTRRLGVAVMCLGLVACEAVVPSAPTSDAIPSATPSAPAATAPPAATPNGTISIGCFLATQSVIEDFRDIAFQLDGAFPLSTQKGILENFVSHLQNTVVAAPVGCFSPQELTALESFWAYVSDTPARELTMKRIDELIAAVGLPYPTPAP